MRLNTLYFCRLVKIGQFSHIFHHHACLHLLHQLAQVGRFTWLNLSIKSRYRLH
mgnify:CR=1 FL=1